MLANQRTAEMFGLVMTAVLCCLVSAASAAQESPPEKLPDSPSAAAQSQATPKPANAVQNGAVFLSVLQEKSRVFPDLATGTEPLDPWQKFKLAANNSVALSTFGAALIGAAFGQAIDSPAGYGQGGEGYGKRFGADMARASSGQMFGTFLIASATHQDPRFFVRKGLTLKQAVRYAAVRVFVARSDSGERMANYSGLFGPLAGEALATSYYPDGNNGAGDVFTRYASDLGWELGGNLLRQYWPSINRRLHLMPPVPEPAPPPKKPR